MLQAAMMDTVEVVSRGVQTSGLVRKITDITRQIRPHCSDHLPMRQRVVGYLRSSHCLLLSGWQCPRLVSSTCISCTRNQMCVPIRPIRGAQEHGIQHRSLGFSPLSSRPSYPSTFLVRYPRPKAGNCRERAPCQSRSDPLGKHTTGEEAN